jgi:hypothetical protein
MTLKPGLFMRPLGSKSGSAGRPAAATIFRTGGMGVAAALGVGVDIELDLADAAIELLGERLVLVVEALVGVGILRLPELALAGRDASVVAVVGADDLDLVELHGGIGDWAWAEGRVLPASSECDERRGCGESGA